MEQVGWIQILNFFLNAKQELADSQLKIFSVLCTAAENWTKIIGDNKINALEVRTCANYENYIFNVRENEETKVRKVLSTHPQEHSPELSPQVIEHVEKQEGHHRLEIHVCKEMAQARKKDPIFE